MRYLFIIIFIFCSNAILFADTIIMKDGSQVKGLVIDEYVDRIILSTVDGEKNIFRKEIERIEYDAPEQNFVQLGKSYDERERYDKAAFYYKKALEVNPDYKQARALYLASHEKLWRQEEKMTKKEIERQNMVLNWWKDKNRGDLPPPKDKERLLKKKLGFSLVQKDGIFTIMEVEGGSSSAKAGIEEGDILAGIWGKLIRYSQIQDVIDELLGPKYSEVKVVVEKKISIAVGQDNKDLYKDLGISLVFEYEGLTVQDVISGGIGSRSGLKKGDFIISLDENLTRYMPLDSVIILINTAEKNKEIVFTIRRNINLRREGE